jgi:hypothetical protein
MFTVACEVPDIQRGNLQVSEFGKLTHLRWNRSRELVSVKKPVIIKNVNGKNATLMSEQNLEAFTYS